MSGKNNGEEEKTTENGKKCVCVFRPFPPGKCVIFSVKMTYNFISHCQLCTIFSSTCQIFRSRKRGCWNFSCDAASTMIFSNYE